MHHPAWTAMRDATEYAVEAWVKIPGMTAADPAPLEIVGMMRMWAELHRLPIAVQPPKDRTGISHEDLRRIGMWSGGTGHADEAQAIRHGLHYLMQNGHRPTLELLAPPPGEDDQPAEPRAPRTRRVERSEAPW